MLNVSSRESQGFGWFVSCFGFFLWLGRIALVLLKNQLIEATSSEGLQSIHSWKHWTSFLDLTASFSHGKKVSLHTVFENKIILLPNTYICTSHDSLYSHLQVHCHVFWPVWPPHCGLSEQYPPQKIQMFIPDVMPMLLQLFFKNQNFMRRLFIFKCIREVFFEGILECLSFKMTFLGFL